MNPFLYFFLSFIDKLQKAEDKDCCNAQLKINNVS